MTDRFVDDNIYPNKFLNDSKNLYKILYYLNSSGWYIYEKVSFENKALNNWESLAPAGIQSQDNVTLDQYVTCLQNCEIYSAPYIVQIQLPTCSW